MSVQIPVLQGRGMTMSDQLARWARRTPDVSALRFEGAGLTYGELDDRVTRLARALAERGVGVGDRVAVLALNAMEVWEAYLAGVRLGAIVVPVNFRLVADEVAYVLADSGAVALVVDSLLAEVAAKAREQVPGCRIALVIGGGDAGPASEDYEAALQAAPAEPIDLVVDESAPAFIMYTSGTTGRPKGAVLTHHNLLMHAFRPVATNGVDLTTSELYVAHGPAVADEDVRVGPRIGVDYAREWAAHPWRFWVATSRHISRRRITGVALDRAMLG